MKKLFAAILILTILTIPLALLCGCEEVVLSDISERSEEIVFSDASVPEEEILSSDTLGPDDQTTPEENVPEFTEEGEKEETLPQETEEKAETPSGEKDTSTEIHNEEEAPYVYREPTSDRETYVAACAAANVNVRRGAGTDCGILFTLGIGDSLPYLWQEAVGVGQRFQRALRMSERMYGRRKRQQTAGENSVE